MLLSKLIGGTTNLEIILVNIRDNARGFSSQTFLKLVYHLKDLNSTDFEISGKGSFTIFVIPYSL